MHGRLLRCSGHFALDRVVLRVLNDLGYAPCVLTSTHLLQVESAPQDQWLSVANRKHGSDSESSPKVLLEARKYLRRVGIIVVAADGGVAHAEPTGHRLGGLAFHWALRGTVTGRDPAWCFAVRCEGAQCDASGSLAKCVGPPGGYASFGSDEWWQVSRRQIRVSEPMSTVCRAAVRG